MVDALEPAVIAMENSDRSDLTALLGIAAKAAEEGVENTKNYIARFGRAKSLMERAIGYQDAGATSVSILFTSMYRYPAGITENRGGKKCQGKKLYFGTNLKMYKGIRETVSYLCELEQLTADMAPENVQLFVIPSYTSLPDAIRSLRHKQILLGAQNMCWEEQGQFTGEISPLCCGNWVFPLSSWDTLNDATFLVKQTL